MKKLLAFVLALGMVFSCFSATAGTAEEVSADDILGMWYSETYLSPLNYPWYVFSGTSLSQTFEFRDDGTMIWTDFYSGESVYTWRLEGNVIYTGTYSEQEPVLGEGEGVAFFTAEEGKLVYRLVGSDGILDYEEFFSHEPVSVVFAEKKDPESMADFAGTWRISGFGLDQAFISAEDMGIEGTAEITDNVMVMKWTMNGGEKERTYTFQPELRNGALFYTDGAQSVNVTLREDGSLLFTVGFGIVLWTFVPME